MAVVVAVDPVYWTVEVDAVKVPLDVIDKGVPVPDKMTVLEEASSISELVDEAFPRVKTDPTVMFPERV